MTIEIPMAGEMHPASSSCDQWPSLPSYETPGGMDLPWHGHFFLSDTAAVFTAAVLT